MQEALEESKYKQTLRRTIQEEKNPTGIIQEYGKEDSKSKNKNKNLRRTSVKEVESKKKKTRRRKI